MAETENFFFCELPIQGKFKLACCVLVTGDVAQAEREFGQRVWRESCLGTICAQHRRVLTPQHMESVVEAMAGRIPTGRRVVRNSVQELLDSESDDSGHSNSGLRRPARQRTPPAVIWDNEHARCAPDRGIAKETERNRAQRTALLASDSDDDSPQKQAEKWAVRRAPGVGPTEAPRTHLENSGHADCATTSLARDDSIQSSRPDKELILWLNSQGFPSALLCSSVADLRSGQIVYDCMDVFLCHSHPETLTLAPGHPGPPASRIAATLDALISFLEDDGVVVQDAEKLFEHLSVLQQSLRQNTAALAAGGWWVDELLMWIVGMFRYIAGAGAFPDSARLVTAVKARPLGVHHDRRDEKSNAKVSRAHASNYPEQGQIGTRSPPKAVGMVPRATPPFRCLPQPHRAQHSQAKTSAYALMSSKHSNAMSVSEIVFEDVRPDSRPGKALPLPSSKDKKVLDRRTDKGERVSGGGDSDTHDCHRTQTLAWRSPVGLVGGPSTFDPRDEPQREGANPRSAPSPLHSGRPSAFPVTPTRPRRSGTRVPAAACQTRGGAGAVSGVRKDWRKLSVAQLRIVQWLENVGVEFPRVEAEESAAGGGTGALGKRRSKGVVQEDVLQALCDGAQLCVLVQRLEAVELRGVAPSESCVHRAPKVQNLEKMLAVLRDKRRSMPSRYMASVRVWVRWELARGGGLEVLCCGSERC